MAFYAVTQAGAAASTSNDSKTLVTAATGQGSVIRVHEINIAGEAGSSAVLRFRINRPGTAGITIGATVQTPEKLDPASVAAVFSVAGSYTAGSSWSTQPVLSTNDVLTPTINAFGGQYRWVAPPEAYIVVGSQGAIANLSMRSGSGTSNFSVTMIVEER